MHSRITPSRNGRGFSMISFARTCVISHKLGEKRSAFWTRQMFIFRADAVLPLLSSRGPERAFRGGWDLGGALRRRPAHQSPFTFTEPPLHRVQRRRVFLVKFISLWKVRDLRDEDWRATGSWVRWCSAPRGGVSPATAQGRKSLLRNSHLWRGRP